MTKRVKDLLPIIALSLFPTALIWLPFFLLPHPAQVQPYKNQSLIVTLDNNATSLEMFNSVLYIATVDDENKGILQKYSGFEFDELVGSQALIELSEICGKAS